MSFKGWIATILFIFIPLLNTALVLLTVFLVVRLKIRGKSLI
jgi:hypothetical protein